MSVPLIDPLGLRKFPTDEKRLFVNSRVRGLLCGKGEAIKTHLLIFSPIFTQKIFATHSISVPEKNPPNDLEAHSLSDPKKFSPFQGARHHEQLEVDPMK